MKRSHVSSTSDDQLPDTGIPTLDQLKPNHLSALDVNNFAVSWPIWLQQFQIYLSATQDQLTDQKKLAIFLNCLGKDGIAVATSYFPSLIHFESAEAKNVTLEMVCSRFNDHCSSAGRAKPQDAYLASHKFLNTYIAGQGIDDFYAKLLAVADQCNFKCGVCQTSYTERIVRDQLVEAVSDKYTVPELLNLNNPSSQEIITKYEEIKRDQEIWTKILNHLCPCDIEAIGQTSFRMQQLVDMHVDTRSYDLQIEPCCLRKHPICTDQKFYKKYKATDMYLGLKSIPESDVNQVLQFFNTLDHLALYNMQILDELDAFPENLSRLTITNSVIEGQLLQDWLDNNRARLWCLTMENVKHSFPLNGQGGHLGKELLIEYSNLNYVTIRCDSLNLRVGSSVENLWYLDIQAKRLINFHLDSKSNLQELIWNVPVYPNKFPDSLTDLTLADWNESSVNRIKFQNLDSLTISSPVDIMFKEQIEKLNIENVLVTYKLDVLEEPELIFEMLNDDCFLEILSYLTNPEWIKFGQLHPRSAWIVLTYKYPRANLTGSDFDDSTITPQSFHEICPYVRSMAIDNGWTREFLCEFTELRSLTLDVICITKENIGKLPVGLEKLRLRHCYYGTPIDLTDYFKQLSSTLRVLEVDDFEDYDDHTLMEFRGLREIKLCSKYGSFSKGIALFLKQNPDLKRVDFNFMVEDMWEALGTLKHLSVVSLSMDRYSKSLMTVLLEKIGSQLKSLSCARMWQTASNFFRSEELLNLQELKLCVRDSVNPIIDNICWLKGLRKLQIKREIVRRRDFRDVYDSDDSYYDKVEFINVSPNNVIQLVKELPNLRQIQTDMLQPFSVKFGLHLQQYLREKNRNLRINSADL